MLVKVLELGRDTKKFTKWLKFYANLLHKICPMTSPKEKKKETLPGFSENLLFKTQASPLGPVVDQASDLPLHGVLDVVRGVEAYGRVVGCADHLTLVVDVGGGDEGLGLAVVGGADGFVFLPASHKSQPGLEPLAEASGRGTNLTFGLQVDLKGVSPALIHNMWRPQPGFVPGNERARLMNPNFAQILDQFAHQSVCRGHGGGQENPEPGPLGGAKPSFQQWESDAAYSSIAKRRAKGSLYALA